MAGRWVAAAVSAIVVTLMSLSFGATAAAVDQPPGVLVVIPASGNLDTPIDVSTAGFCERGTTFMVTVSGKGIDGDGDEIIVGATDLRWLEPTGYTSYDVALSLTLDSFFDRADVVRPQGEYMLTFICRNRLDVEPLQTFTASLIIDKKGRYEAQGISALTLPEALDELGIDSTPIPGTDDVEVSETDSSDASLADDVQQAPTDSAATTGEAATEPGQPDSGASQVPAPEVVQASATAQDPGSLRSTLLSVGALLIVGAMAAWIWMSRRDSRKPATPNRAPSEDVTS